ncbi:TPA: transposase, partial [Escherichia coli]
PGWGCGRFPGLSGDKTSLLKKKKSAPLSFISNMVRSWLPSYANWATLRKGICVVGAAHGKQVVA